MFSKLKCGTELELLKSWNIRRQSSEHLTETRRKGLSDLQAISVHFRKVVASPQE